MKLLLVNPNTTAPMTAKMRDAACAVASKETEIVAVTAEYGPESIKGYYDEVFSDPAMLDAVKGHPDAAGVVVGCFDDTGIDAAQCVTSAPCDRNLPGGDAGRVHRLGKLHRNHHAPPLRTGPGAPRASLWLCGPALPGPGVGDSRSRSGGPGVR